MSVRHSSRTTEKSSKRFDEAWLHLKPEQKIRVTVPQRAVFGIQPTTEYRNKATKDAKKGYSTLGQEFLQQCPVFVVALWNTPEHLRLILVDGHHRARYAPLYGIYQLPCEVTFVETLEVVTEYVPGSLAPLLMNWVDNTIATFGKNEVHAPGQCLKVPRVTKVHDLAEVWDGIFR